MTEQPTRGQKCDDLARAMGWTIRETIPGITKIWFTPDGLYSPSGYPDPFTNAADNRALVAWLAAQVGLIQEQFYYLVCERIGELGNYYRPAQKTLRVMSAPLPVIAEAAWLAMQEVNNG